MNNEIQNFSDEKERARINLFIEVSLISLFVTIIVFSAIVLLA